MSRSNLILSVSGSDTGSVQEKNTVVNDYNDGTEVIGRNITAYEDYFAAGFWQFDLTGIPAGATVTGCVFQLTNIASYGTGDQSGVEFVMGFLADDGIWSNGSGFNSSNYARASNLPFGEWNSGGSEDLTVWVDGLGPKSATTGLHSEEVAGFAVTYGDGTDVPTIHDAVSGLAAHLQLAIDAYGGVSPKVAIHAYREFGTTVGNMTVGMADHGTPTSRPVLHVGWTPPPPSTTVTLTPQIQSGGGTMTVTMSAACLSGWGEDVSALTTWTSSLEGLLHTGATLVEQDLRVGVHAMSVVATSNTLKSGLDQTGQSDYVTRWNTGTGYSNGDVVTMSDGSEAVIYIASTADPQTDFNPDDFYIKTPGGTSVVNGVWLEQVSVTPAGGTGFRFQPTIPGGNIEVTTRTTTFTITVFDVPTDLAAAVTASTVPVGTLQIAGGILSAGAGGGAGEKGIAVIDALPIA